MKPYYEIKPDVKNIIVGLMEKCQELQLGNCSFELYNEATIYILELKNGWEARVKAGRYLDIYKVTDDKELKYEFTE